MNSTVTGPEPGVEVKLRGTARVVDDPELQDRYAARVSADLGLLIEELVDLVVKRGEYGGQMAWVEQSAGLQPYPGDTALPQ